MPYIERKTLQSYGTQSHRSLTEHLQKSSASAAQASVFLSHSHSDHDLVEAACSLLASQGVSVYVDWKDGSMPDSTGSETAVRLKAAIGRNSKFVLLATDAAVRSRWVPWELGFADATLGADRIALMPIVDPSRRFEGSEYLQLYSSLEFDEVERLGVFPPAQNKGATLANWLMR
jgi:hypothetical protein